MKRVIHYLENGVFKEKVINFEWDKDNVQESREGLEYVMQRNYITLPRPWVNVSLTNVSQRRNISCYGVKDDKGVTIKLLWDTLDKNPERNLLPPGAYEYIYIIYLNEDQFDTILSGNTFYDMYYNPDSTGGSISKACIALKLLSKQRKLDYIYEPNKFLHWFWCNCAFPELSISKE